METFVFTMFCLYCLGFVLRTIVILISNYPRNEEKTVAGDVISLIQVGSFSVWTAYLLWG